MRDQPNSSVIGSSSKPSAIMGNTVEPKSVPTMIAAATLSLRGRNRIRQVRLRMQLHVLALHVIVRSAHQLQRSRQLREQLFAELRIDVEEGRAGDLV